MLSAMKMDHRRHPSEAPADVGLSGRSAPYEPNVVASTKLATQALILLGVTHVSGTMCNLCVGSVNTQGQSFNASLQSDHFITGPGRWSALHP
jgi:hypothetical protein